MDSTLYWLWLAEALGSGCRLAGRLLEEYPDPAELYGQVKAGWNPPEYLSSTISVVTSFFAASLTMLRSSYYALGYASNDIVLIILWILASIKDPGYIPVVVNFLIFFLNDMYGFICWKKRETAQC